MPQHLRIEASGKLVGTMSTYNTSDTSYDVTWCGPDETCYRYLNTNTGIQRQPSDAGLRQIDFRNDFVHARRSIGAGLVTAVQVLGELQSRSSDNAAPIGEVLIRLATNKVDRGVITITPEDENAVTVTMRIGNGPTRAPNASPSEVVEFTRKGVEIKGANTPFTVALVVLVSAGQWMLKALKEAA